MIKKKQHAFSYPKLTISKLSFPVQYRPLPHNPSFFSSQVKVIDHYPTQKPGWG